MTKNYWQRHEKKYRNPPGAILRLFMILFAAEDPSLWKRSGWDWRRTAAT